MDDAIGAFRSRDEADPEVQQQNYAAYWELSADPEKLSKMSEAELYANTPRLGPELTARLLDERQRLQNPDDLADAKLGSDTLIRIARRAGLDPVSDPEAFGDLRQRAQQIFASEQRANQGLPLGWEQKQAIVKHLVAEDALMPAVDRRFFQPDLENAPPGNLSKTLENLLYTRPEGEAAAGLVKLLNSTGEEDSGSNTGEPPASNGEDGAGALQVAANVSSPGGTQTVIPSSPPSNSPETELNAYRGSDPNDVAPIGELTTSDVKNIIFNEMSSLSGPQSDLAYKYIAHTIFNDAEQALKSRRRIPPMARGTRAVLRNPDDMATYAAISAAVDEAYAQRLAGINPIPEARYFSSRGSLSLTPRTMSGYDPVHWAAVFGPFNNSFPNPDVPWTSGGYMYIWFDEESKTHRIIKQGAFDE